MLVGTIEAFYDEQSAINKRTSLALRNPSWRTEMISDFTQIQFWVEGNPNPLVADAADTPPNEKPVHLVISVPPQN